MTAQFNLKDEGVLNLLDRLGSAPQSQACERALYSSLEGICLEAKMLCPKDTGALADSLHVQMACEGGAPCGSVKSSLPYAAAVEMGTAHSAAQPFLYPAFKAAQPGLLQSVMRAVMDETGR